MIENVGNLSVLTPEGYKLFQGIQRRTQVGYFHIITDTDRELRCSPNHFLLQLDGEFVPAYQLNVDDKIVCKFSAVETIEYIEFINETIDLYDIVEVENHMYYTNDIVSHNCDFIGSSNTLISAEKIRSLPHNPPISKKDNGLWMYENPRGGHKYMMTVDSARGLGEDFSAFTVLDITEVPYKVVAKFRNNEIDPLLYPTIVKNVGMHYNEAYALVEINDIGLQVANSLQRELEYENLMMVSFRGRGGQELGVGFGSKVRQNGIKMSPLVKKVGCSNLKTIVENDKLILNDLDIITEFTTFAANGVSYSAMSGYNDDLIMCLVMFAWCIEQDYFKELTDTNIRKKLEDEKDLELMESISPVGILGGFDEEETIVEDGAVWQIVIL
jgi:hypothetical protein